MVIFIIILCSIATAEYGLKFDYFYENGEAFLLEPEFISDAETEDTIKQNPNYYAFVAMFREQERQPFFEEMIYLAPEKVETTVIIPFEFLPKKEETVRILALNDNKILYEGKFLISDVEMPSTELYLYPAMEGNNQENGSFWQTIAVVFGATTILLSITVIILLGRKK